VQANQPWPNMRLQLTGAALLVQISRGGGGSFGGVRRPQLKRKPFGGLPHVIFRGKTFDS